MMESLLYRFSFGADTSEDAFVLILKKILNQFRNAQHKTI
jgi:hypothetical protein